MTNAKLAITNVKANLKAIEKYKQFPLQLYDRVHIQDRYLSEVSNIVE